MVLPSNAVPQKDSWLARELAKLRRELTEGLASIATSFRPSVDFLLHQTIVAESSPPSFSYYSFDPAEDSPWYIATPFDPVWDLSTTITTSSTGQIAFFLGCYLSLTARDGARASGSVGLEVLAADGVTPVRGATAGDGPLTHLRAPEDGTVGLTTAMNGHAHFLTLAPTTTYTLRSRRLFQSGAGAGATPFTRTGWQGASLYATKIGM